MVFPQEAPISRVKVEVLVLGEASIFTQNETIVSRPQPTQKDLELVWPKDKLRLHTLEQRALGEQVIIDWPKLRCVDQPSISVQE